MKEFLVGLLSNPKVQAGLASTMIFFYWNQIKNFLGYLAFKISPFEEGVVFYHPTSTGEAKATIHKASFTTLALRYDAYGETRYRYIFMSEFVRRSQDWAICYEPAPSLLGK